jgi:hypothetical protein
MKSMLKRSKWQELQGQDGNRGHKDDRPMVISLRVKRRRSIKRAAGITAW